MRFPSRETRLALRFGLVQPLAGALGLLALASFFPLRLDQRNFQDLRRAAHLPVPRGVPYIFVSAGDDGPAYRFAGYALHNLAYPRHAALWLHLTGGDPAGRGLRLDPQGRLWRAGTPSAVDARALAPFAGGVVLYDDDATRAQAERRLPLLASLAHAHVLAAPGPSFMRRAWRSEFSPTRVARLTALLGVAACVGAWLSLALPAAWAWSAAPLATAALLFVALSGAQVLPWRAPGAWPFALWAVCLAALVLRLKRDAGGVPTWPRAPRREAALLVTALGFSAALFVARLDFDEDAHSHWLLQARSYYDLGRHVPEALRDGHIHAATYPFAYSEALALAAWAADLDTARFFWLDLDTALALLFYRLGIAALAVSTLGLLALHLLHLAPRSGLPLAGVALMVTFFPSFQGRHLAAETLLLPLLAGALLLLASGRAPLVALGLFVGGVGTLVKLEAGLLFAAVVLPWICVRPRAGRVAALVALGAGLAPTLVWRATLEVGNPVYVAPTLATLGQVLPLAPRVALDCLQVLLRENLAWPLLLALPLATAFSLSRRASSMPAWRLLVVPASVYVSVALLASIYLFTTLPRTWQIEVSFPRLLLLPLFSALLYALEALAPESEAAR